MKSVPVWEQGTVTGKYLCTCNCIITTFLCLYLIIFPKIWISGYSPLLSLKIFLFLLPRFLHKTNLFSCLTLKLNNPTLNGTIQFYPEISWFFFLSHILYKHLVFFRLELNFPLMTISPLQYIITSHWFNLFLWIPIYLRFSFHCHSFYFTNVCCMQFSAHGPLSSLWRENSGNRIML